MIIKSGKETIELRKVRELSMIVGGMGYFERDADGVCKWNYNLENGRLFSKVFDGNFHIQGTITINGYEIIKNPWFGKYEYYIRYKDFWTYFDENIFMWISSNFGHLGNVDEDWIYDNWDWLIDYFRDEPEILVLKTESWEEKND